MSRQWQAALLVGLSMITVACGKKGPLIYPEMLVPAAPTAVTAQQSGAVVKLQFVIPDKDGAGRPLQGFSGVKINRRATEVGQKNVCTSCLSDYRLFRTLYIDHLPANTQRLGSRLIIVDDDVSAGNIYSYLVVPFTADSVDGISSLAAEARVITPPPAPDLKIQPFPTEVKLRFSSQPVMSGTLLGYNLYRWSAVTARSYLPLNREPIKGNDYVDSNLERGLKYRYSARALIQLTSGNIAESAESNEVEGVLKDDE
ncbi:MAG: hypothetical protein HGA20_10715 [Geobacteraceae bacterium]|nr:hypothetical protein [Geobacteraceae bacterium]